MGEFYEAPQDGGKALGRFAQEFMRKTIHVPIQEEEMSQKSNLYLRKISEKYLSLILKTKQVIL